MWQTAMAAAILSDFPIMSPNENYREDEPPCPPGIVAYMRESQTIIGMIHNFCTIKQNVESVTFLYN